MSITFGLLLLGIGVFALFLGLRLLWGMPAALSQTSGVRLAARRWPAAPGTIIGAEVRVALQSGEEYKQIAQRIHRFLDLPAPVRSISQNDVWRGQSKLAFDTPASEAGTR
jgi:hypothetical protein